MKRKVDILVFALIILVTVSLLITANSNNGNYRAPVRETFITKLISKYQNSTPQVERVTYIPNNIPAKIPILVYHYVEYNRNPADYLRTRQNIVPHIFEEQLKTLKENSYTTIFLKDIADYFDGRAKLPEKSIALTFDDGYRDFYTDVFPLLKKYQAKATVYIIVNFLGGHNFLTKDQLKEIANSDLVEVGSHTLNHLYLKGIKAYVIEKELTESKKELEDLTGKPILDFSYPYGAFDTTAEKLVEKTGYQTATTTLPGEIQSINTRFALTRLRPGARTGQTLIKWLENEVNK